MEESLRQARLFFLETSSKTYAANARKATIAELPKSKVLTYAKDPFLYVDCYFASEEARSGGQTVIWHDGIPIWMMQYHGVWEKHDERINPFLKRALLAAYNVSLFHGGRGPAHYREGNLMYSNLLFWHEYVGFALLGKG